MARARTKERQYQALLEHRGRHGTERMGLMTSQYWHDDPKRLGFVLARYKFVAKMFAGYGKVLEIGCGDGFASRVVHAEVKRLVLVDFDPLFIQDVAARLPKDWRGEAKVHDLMRRPVPGGFDGVYALDVLEHVAAKDEHRFLRNLARSLAPRGSAILGMPSLESQPWASAQSKDGHVNCKSLPDFRRVMQRHFHHVFMFTMNDEVVGTGYHRMAHYLFALCAGPKR
ncbi:MAG: class I SAM-dependent methyltransferase [Alphaproteobacteria bacterium]|nr:class I SAM-dependent methyltransferase [Alphaproteobacteria bacterium]